MMAEKNNLPELPQGWVWTRLGKVSILGAGNPAPQGKEYFENGIYPFVRVRDMGNLGNNVYIYDTKDHINSKAIDRLKLFHKGDVLFTKSGMSILLNQRAILGRDMYVVSHIGIAIVLDGIPSEWLYYFLITIDFKNLTHATTLPSLRLSKVQEIPVPLPPLTEQHRIVAKIEELFTKLDAGVEALKKVKIQLKRHRQAVLKYAFEGKLTEEWRDARKGELEPPSVLLERIKEERKNNGKRKYGELPSVDTLDLLKLPEGWIFLTLNDIAANTKNSIKRGPFGSSVKKEYFVPSGYKVYEQKNVIYNNFNLGNYYIDGKKFNELKDFELKSGDIVISCSGTIGKIAIAPPNLEKGIINQALLKIILDETKVLSKYFVYLFKSKLQEIILHSTRGSAMKNISSVRALKQILFPITSLFEQHKIIEEIELWFSIADEVEKVVEQSLKQAERLRQSILKKAFEGKLVPQDPTDEPASVLLERIKEEKAKEEEEKK